uniref:Uncharacterized protein n=1 Tax=Aureoumbra lagunensis TaxID=44058 RepID=A0A7S3JTK6_9STRA|mmetsp:Transcript_4733/g.6708  ORF Transcript_4733/g.6708 Transcript_4733/m.6708 type:complete len:104 (+) Transcript_4733:93-404(+)
MVQHKRMNLRPRKPLKVTSTSLNPKTKRRSKKQGDVLAIRKPPAAAFKMAANPKRKPKLKRGNIQDILEEDSEEFLDVTSQRLDKPQGESPRRKRKKVSQVSS